VQLAVPGEQFWQVLCTDTYSNVVHMNHEVLLLQVVASHDFDLPLSCELFCILDEVNQDLLQPSFIAKEKSRQMPWLVIDFLSWLGLRR